MSEKRQKSVAPGLIKSVGYSKPKAVTLNPTLKTMVEDLPTAEKSVMYTLYYADNMSETNWVPPQGELNITPEMLVVETDKKSNNKDVKSEIKVEKPKKFTKPKEKEDIIVTNSPKIIDKLPSDMEIVLNQSEMLKEVKQETKHSEVFNIGDIKLEDKPKAQEPNMFNMVNSVAPVEVEKKDDSKENLVKEKAYMRIDNVEVKNSVNSEGRPVYMVGKKVYDQDQFEKYIQEICGKILAGDCKHIEFNEISYDLQPSGDYKSSTGRMLSVDDMMALINSK